MIARSCSCKLSELKGRGRKAKGTCEDRGGTEIREASGALVGGSKVACGLHDDGAASETFFLEATGSVLRTGRSSSRLVRALALVSVGLSGLLVVLRISVSCVFFVVSVVTVVAVFRFKLERASVCPPFSFSSVGESAAEAGREVFERTETDARLSARLAARDGPFEDIVTPIHFSVGLKLRRSS